MISVGDEIVVVRNPGSHQRIDQIDDKNDSILVGDTGYVCYVNNERKRIGVCFYKFIDEGHSCGGRCDAPHGWYMHESCVELMDDADGPDFVFDNAAFVDMNS